MAKFYQRQSTGGRFDRKSVGDLGLRAFKDQQDQILDSLKLQRLRSYEYGKQNIQDIESSQRKEQNWKEELQQLETKIHNNKVKNITKRGEDEADILLTKAEEYKRESEFWQDFAPKFSKGLGDAAVGITNYVGEKAAKKEFERWKADGGLEEYFKGQESAATLQANLEQKHLEQAKDQEENNYVSQVGLFGKARFEEKVAAEIIASIEGIHAHLVKQLDNSKNVDYENLRQEYESLLDQLIKREGIDPRSKAANDIHKAFGRRRIAEATERKERHEARVNGEVLEDQTTSVYNLSRNPYTTSEDYRSSEFRVLMTKSATAKVFDSNGRVIDPKNTSLQFVDKNLNYKINYQQAGLHAYLELIEQIKSPSENMNFEEWKAKNNYLTSEGEYFLEKHAKTYDPVLQEAYSKRIIELEKNQLENEKADSVTLKWKAGEDLAKYDLTDPKQRQELISKWHEHPPGHVARSLISEAMGYDPKHHNSIDHINNLQLAIEQGDSVEAIELWSYLTPDGQKEYIPQIKDLQNLQNAGITYKSVHDYAKAEVELISKKDKLSGAPTHSSNKDAIEGMTDAYFYYNNQLREKFPDVRERETEIKIKLQADLDYKNSDGTEGRGWARRSTPSSGRSENNVVWSNYVPEIDKNTLLTTDNVKESLAGDTNTLKDLLNYNENGNIVKQDDLDRINDVILEGRGNFPKSENVDYLSARYNMTRRDVWNQILTHKYGEDATLIPPGPEELAIHQIEQSTVILPNSTKHYSTENKVRLGVLTKLVESQAAGINAFMKKELTNPVDWTIVPTSNRITEGYKYVDINGDYPIYNPLAGTTYFAE